MADYEEEDVVTLVPDPITGLPPPIFGYDGVDKDLGYYDYFVMSALLIAFCGAIVSERNCNALRLFELMEIVITSLFGIACYFVPSFIFNVLVGGYDCDIIHMLLVQANGAALLGLAGCRIRFFCAGKMTKSGQSSLVFARLIVSHGQHIHQSLNNVS
ncbi:hypothetical protein LSAT2_028279 [Lamellibrachia satsuma]|nr:hypothetical protein LSAT2_028279 [Lamellibrachia satsuma]